MRKTIIVVAVFAALALTAQSALAVSVHWKHGSPSFHDNGLTLTESGTVSGVGGGDVLITLTAQANVNATCTNGGSHQAPGQNPAPISVSGSQSFPASEIKNGNLTYSVTTNSPGSSVAGAPDCPNSNWTEDINDLAFTSATLTVTQGITVFDAPKSTCSLTPLAYPSGVGDVTSFSCPK